MDFVNLLASWQVPISLNCYRPKSDCIENVPLMTAIPTSGCWGSFGHNFSTDGARAMVSNLGAATRRGVVNHFWRGRE